MQPNELTHEQVCESLGFDPYDHNTAVYGCAKIESGAWAGYWSVLTDSLAPIETLYSRPNFANAIHGTLDEANGRKPGLIYLFRPVNKEKLKAKSA